MESERQFNIIGGGIAGISTALAFQNFGIKYKLYEKKSNITYENVGFGISANIFHILEKWNIFEETKKIGAEIQKFHFVDKNLKYINSFEIEKPALSVKRNEFHRIILDKLNKENIILNSEKDISDFQSSEFIISADGINSIARQKLYPNLKLRDSKQILWRGITKINLDEKFKNSYHDFVGNNLRFAIIDTGNNFYSWYAIKQRNSSNENHFDKEELTNLFAKYHPIVKQIINKSENIYFSELKDISPKSRRNLDWFKNNTLLIGDSIHATTPNMANGGCLAMEDAYLLSHLLKNKLDNIDNLFRKFQFQRTKKVNAVVNQSWYFGQLLHQKNKIFDRLINIGFAITPKFIFDKIYSTVLTETKIEN